jgi:hypothetical protein
MSVAFQKELSDAKTTGRGIKLLVNEQDVTIGAPERYEKIQNFYCSYIIVRSVLSSAL